MADQVQLQLAAGLLNQFHVSIGLNLVHKLQDWPGRQQTQYGAVKGLMNKDWHSLSDFNSEMAKYSSASHTLRIAWALIKSIVPNNPKMLSTLVTIPGLGQVGPEMKSLVGITNILVAPQSILKNASQFQSTIKSIS
jgi:hypothetical protein